MSDSTDSTDSTNASDLLRRTVAIFREIDEVRRQLEMPKESLPILLDIYSRQLASSSGTGVLKEAFVHLMRVNTQMFESTMRVLATTNSDLRSENDKLTEENSRLRSELDQLRTQRDGLEKLMRIGEVAEKLTR